MSREKYFRHGQLKEFVTNPANWKHAHVFKTASLPSIKCVSRRHGVTCSSERTGKRGWSSVTFKPLPA